MPPLLANNSHNPSFSDKIYPYIHGASICGVAGAALYLGFSVMRKIVNNPRIVVGTLGAAAAICALPKAVELYERFCEYRYGWKRVDGDQKAQAELQAILKAAQPPATFPPSPAAQIATPSPSASLPTPAASSQESFEPSIPSDWDLDDMDNIPDLEDHSGLFGEPEDNASVNAEEEKDLPSPTGQDEELTESANTTEESEEEIYQDLSDDEAEVKAVDQPMPPVEDPIQKKVPSPLSSFSSSSTLIEDLKEEDEDFQDCNSDLEDETIEAEEIFYDFPEEESEAQFSLYQFTKTAVQHIPELLPYAPIAARIAWRLFSRKLKDTLTLEAKTLLIAQALEDAYNKDKEKNKDSIPYHTLMVKPSDLGLSVWEYGIEEIPFPRALSLKFKNKALTGNYIREITNILANKALNYGTEVAQGAATQVRHQVLSNMPHLPKDPQALLLDITQSILQTETVI